MKQFLNPFSFNKQDFNFTERNKETTQIYIEYLVNVTEIDLSYIVKCFPHFSVKEAVNLFPPQYAEEKLTQNNNELYWGRHHKISRQFLLNFVLDYTNNDDKKYSSLLLNEYDFTDGEKIYITDRISLPIVWNRLVADPRTVPLVLMRLHDLHKNHRDFDIDRLLLNPNTPVEVLEKYMTEKTKWKNIVGNPNTPSKLLYEIIQGLSVTSVEDVKCLKLIVKRKILDDRLFLNLFVSLQRYYQAYFSSPIRSVLNSLISCNVQTEQRGFLLWKYAGKDAKMEYLKLFGENVPKILRLEAVLGGLGVTMESMFPVKNEWYEALVEYNELYADYNFSSQFNPIPMEWMMELLKPVAEERMKDSLT